MGVRVRYTFGRWNWTTRPDRSRNVIETPRRYYETGRTIIVVSLGLMTDQWSGSSARPHHAVACVMGPLLFWVHELVNNNSEVH